MGGKRYAKDGKKKMKTSKIIILTLLIIILFAFFFSGAYAFVKNFVLIKLMDNYSEEDAYDHFDERVNVLLLGSDSRDMESIERTDTIILASVEKSTGKVVLLSIPRDTLVYLDGYGECKINSASTVGGLDLTVETVEDLLNVPIDYYVLVNFEGFTGIIDAIGGVTINVEERMYHEDPYHPELTIDLQPGEQLLDGNEALQYVRYRSYVYGDIDRASVQQQFLVTVAKELLQAKTITKLPKLIPAVMNCVETNISITDMLLMSKLAYKVDIDNITTQTLPGTFLDTDASYWQIDEEQAQTIIDDLYNNGATPVVNY